MISRQELIKKYIEFFKSKNHKEIPNASLIPENDPTVLFTTAGMQPLVPFFVGEKHPLGKRLVNVQRCIRTVDIDSVGDTYHHTFFEMLGNWSLGDYWKEEAIKLTFEFLTKSLGIPKEKLAVTCFKGNKDIPKDEEAAKIWGSLGISKERIAFLDDNWWGPAGTTGPCGPNTEIFYWKSETLAPKKFDPSDEKNWVEIGNDVLLEYTKDKLETYQKLKQKNIDFGGGVERMLASLNNLDDNYKTECFKPLIEEIEKLSEKKYGKNSDDTRIMRIIADHIKAAVFILAEGIVPGNAEQGYVLRRLIRRAIMQGKKLGIPKEKDITTPITKKIIKIYEDYPELKKKETFIIDELNKEEDKFEKTLEIGLRELKKITQEISANEKISGKKAFLLYQSYGFPVELTKEIALKEFGVNVDEKSFYQELSKHQELSRTASAGKFKSGLADNSEATTKLHTATHLLLQALKVVLKDSNIEQRGANITPERLRFDFSFPRKLTNDEMKKVEDLVNSQIQSSCEVVREEMSPAKAKSQGACGIFDKKYGDKVSVYTIGKFSKEICTGPHVKNTCELGHFKITKEESSSSGVRRIKAVLENSH